MRGVQQRPRHRRPAARSPPPTTRSHLVPFGEYLPFRPLFDLFGIRQLVAIPEDSRPAPRGSTLTRPGAAPFAPLICYEIIFPGAVVADRPRPGWMLNLTNDTWFGDTPGPHQHFLPGRVRAVEEGCHWSGRRTRESRRSLIPMGGLSTALALELRELSMGTFRRLRHLRSTPGWETGSSSVFWLCAVGDVVRWREVIRGVQRN